MSLWLLNCYLALGNIDKNILHSEKLNDFNDSYVLKDDKKIFFSELANMSIEKFKYKLNHINLKLKYVRF